MCLGFVVMVNLLALEYESKFPVSLTLFTSLKISCKSTADSVLELGPPAGHL